MDTEVIIDKIKEMIKEIQVKSASETRYYQGATDGLSLLLKTLSPVKEEDNGE